MSQAKKQDGKSRTSPGHQDKSRQVDGQPGKSDGKTGLIQTFRKKVSEFRGSMRMGKDQAAVTKKESQVTDKQKKQDIEKVINERMQHWGRTHNLPDWAQQRIAKSVLQEDERRKRRAELEAKKLQLLKKATLRHAIVIGDKAAAAEKTKLQAKDVMKDMRKGDSALPYTLKTLNLENLFSEQSASQTSTTSDNINAEVAGVVGLSVPSPPAAPEEKAKGAKTRTDKQAGQGEPEAPKQMFDAIFSAQSGQSQAITAPRASVETPTPNAGATGDIDPGLQEYIGRLHRKDLWENESNENALYNWIISQSSPDDARNKVAKRQGPRVEFDKTVVGRTYPKGKAYAKGEQSVEYRNTLLG